MEHLLDDEQYYRMETLAKEFEEKTAPRLQKYLVLKSWWATNYVSSTSWAHPHPPCVLAAHTPPSAPTLTSHPPLGERLVGGVRLPPGQEPHRGQQQLLRHGESWSHTGCSVFSSVPTLVSGQNLEDSSEPRR